MNKNVLRDITYGLYVISTLNDKKPTGCVVNSVMQITYDSVAISLNHTNFTNECIKNCKKFGVSILTENIRPEIFGIFGYKTGRDFDKFSQVKYVEVDGLNVLNEGCCGYITCDVIDSLETETHTIFIGKMVEAEVLNSDSPMSYAYYHKVLKGSSPKAAPTYIKEEESVEEAVKYRCGVCGYIYEGDITKEPEDFKCPICSQHKTVFKLIEKL